MEPAALESLAKEAKAISVPHQNLHLVPPFVEEDKEVAAQRILPNELLRRSSEPIEALAEVDRLGGKVDANRRWKR
jgi:hypothetical protein